MNVTASDREREENEPPANFVDENSKGKSTNDEFTNDEGAGKVDVDGTINCDTDPAEEVENVFSPNSSMDDNVSDDDIDVSTLKSSDLSHKDLCRLFNVLREDHPDALFAALQTLGNNSMDDDSSCSSNKEDNVKRMMAKFDGLKEKRGCYLYYDPSSAKLKLLYTSSPHSVPNAIGFYTSPTIPEFKYKKNFGRADLIGNCASGVAGRKNFYSGICQFIRAARSAIKSASESIEKEFQFRGNQTQAQDATSPGELWIFPREADHQGLDVDIYMYDAMATYQTVLLPPNKSIRDEILNADAVTCLPKHSDVFVEVKQMELNRWLVRANSVGANIRFTAASGLGPDSLSPAKKVDLIDRTRSPSIKIQEKPKDLGEVPEPPHAEGGGNVKGCYLLYDADCCKLKLQYSSTPVRNAIGFYYAGPGHTIRGFKFTKNFGRADLIGNCASGVTGRKNYYSGWCQFIRAARALNGRLWIYPRTENQPGLDVDLYVYYKNPEDFDQDGPSADLNLNLDGQNSIQLEEGVEINVSQIDAVACLPRHADFFSEIKTMDLNRWMTDGNSIGATSRFE